VSSETLEQIIATRPHGIAPQLEMMLSAEALTRLFECCDRVHLPRAVSNYIARLVSATHPQQPAASEKVKSFVRYGASPRAGIAMAATARAAALLAGKPNAGFDEVRKVAASVLGHRLILDYAARLDGWSPATLVSHLLEVVPEVPRDLPADLSA
jgi:MoxR-like ATPase